MSNVKAFIWLPDECWADVLSQCSRPFVATRLSFVSRQFADLANRRLWTKRRQLAPLFVCCDRIGCFSDEGEHQQHFVERPMPFCAPPKNVQISSITVFICSCLDNVFNLLCHLSAVRSCAVQMDAAVADPCRFRLLERPEFGTIFANAKSIRLGHHSVWGLPLTAFVSCADPKLEKARQSMLNVPILECPLISEADLPHLLFWLHFCPAKNGQFEGKKTVKKQLRFFCDHLPTIKLANAFIRMVIQVFSRSTDSCQFTIEFVMPNNYEFTSASLKNGFNSLLFTSVHYNFETNELLKLSAVNFDQKGRHILLLERRKNEQMSIDANICEEESMDEHSGDDLGRVPKEESVLIIFK